MPDSTSRIEEKEIEYLQQIVQELSGHEGARRFHMARYLADMPEFKSRDLLTGDRRAELAAPEYTAMPGKVAAQLRRHCSSSHLASDAR
jgi:hypothetical protein